MARSIKKNFFLDMDLWNDVEAYMDWTAEAGWSLKNSPSAICSAGLIWFLQATQREQVAFLRQAGVKYGVRALERAEPPSVTPATADDGDAVVEDVLPPLPTGPPAAPKTRRKKRRKTRSG